MLYTGFSSNLLARVEKHNSGGNKSTSYRRPLVLIFSEFYLFEEDARSRELYLKTSMGKKAIKFMLKTPLEKFGYRNMFLKSLQILEVLNLQTIYSLEIIRDFCITTPGQVRSTRSISQS